MVIFSIKTQFPSEPVWPGHEIIMTIILQIVFLNHVHKEPGHTPWGWFSFRQHTNARNVNYCVITAGAKHTLFV